MVAFAFVVRAVDTSAVVAFDLQGVDVRRHDKHRFVSCPNPNCRNNAVEDFAKDVGGDSVLCMICNEKVDPEAQR